MNGYHGVTDERHSLAFDQFLLKSTGKVLKALENMFEFDIETSESSLEIAPGRATESLRSVGEGPLYRVASELLGDLRGQARILIRADDVDHLAEMLKPVMGLMFLSRPGTDLLELDQSRPEWMQDPEHSPMADPEFQAQMMDALAEMGNVLVGVYSRALYEVSACRSMHSLPEVTRDDDEAVLQPLDGAGEAQRRHLVVDHQIGLGGRLVHLRCELSLLPESFNDLLRGMEAAAAPPPAMQEFRPYARAAGA